MIYIPMARKYWVLICLMLGNSIIFNAGCSSTQKYDLVTSAEPIIPTPHPEVQALAQQVSGNPQRQQAASVPEKKSKSDLQLTGYQVSPPASPSQLKQDEELALLEHKGPLLVVIKEKPATNKPSESSQPAVEKKQEVLPKAETETKPEESAPVDEAPGMPAELPAPGVPLGAILTLESLEETVRTNHPSLRQAAHAVAKARGYRQQLSLKPNPTVGYTAEDINEDGGAGRHGLFVNQTFIRGNKQQLDQEVLCREINRLEWEYQVQQARILTDVRQQFYAVLGAQERVKLLKELGENVSKAAEGVKKLVDAGELPEVDYLQLNLLANELKLQQENTEIELKASRRQLAALSGQPQMLVGEVAGSLSGDHQVMDIESLYSQLIANSPQIQAASYRISRAQAMLSRQQRQATPNLQFGASMVHDFTSDDQIFGLQVGIPLPTRNKNQGNISAAMSDYHRAVEQREQLQLSLRSQLTQALGQLQQAENSVRMYQTTIVPQSRKNVEKVQAAYDEGELDLTRLFVAQRSNIEATVKQIQAQVQYQRTKALVDGSLLSGGLINNVDTEVNSGLRGQSLSGQ